MTIVAVYHYVSPLLWVLVIEAVMIDDGVLWDQCYPRYNQWAVMTILCQYSLLCESCCWELCSKTGLLMMVIITQAVVTLMAIMTHFGEILVKVCLKILLAVCSVVNSAGQWVLFVKKEKQSSVCCKKSTIWDQFLELKPWTLNKSPICFLISDFKHFLLFIFVLETP